MTPRDVLDKLMQKAIYRNIVGSPDFRIVEGCIRNGRPIPDRCLPGRILDCLTPEEREVLRGLTSKDTANERFPGK
jgi:hypothetical protein